MRKIALLLVMMLSVNLIYAQAQPIKEEDESFRKLRIEHEVNMTKDPALGYVPKTRLNAANQYRAARLAQHNGRAAATALTWTERGPDSDVRSPLNGNPRPAGSSTAGRIRAMWVDLADPSGKTVWVGGITGGLWKTTDITANPANWTLVDDKLINLSISSITQDPVNTDIMFVGTGERGYAGAVRGGGILRSIDHGNTWGPPMPNTANFGDITKLLCDAAGNLYAGTVVPTNLNPPNGAVGGLYRYNKLSFNWTNITPAGLLPRIADMELSSNGTLHIVCGFDNANAPNTGYRFTSNPATVTSATWNSPVSNVFRTDVNTHITSKGDTLYAIPSNPARQVTGIFKSFDGGLNWAQTGSCPPFTNGQADYCLAIATHPTDGKTLMVGSLDCFASTDAGDNWFKLSEWLTLNPGRYVHADQHDIHWGKSDQLLVCHDGGIDYSADSGITFIDRNLGLRIKQFYSVAVHPTNPNYFLAGAQDNGGHQLTMSGMNTSTEVTPGDGAFAHIDQFQPQFQWLSYTFNDYYTSTDGGATWTNYIDNANQGLFINPTDYDDVSKKMYCSGNNNTFVRWENPKSGATFVPVPLPLGGGKVTAVKVSPYSANTVFFAGGNPTNLATVNIVPSIVKVTNADAAANAVNIIGAGMLINSANISCIELGRDEKHIIASFSNYGVMNVFYTADGGATWRGCDGNLPDMPVRWAMFYPGSNEKAIIATETGVWQTDKLDGAATVWQPEDGFPNVRTDMLQYRRTDRLLAAATHGRGIFTANIKPDDVKNFKFTKLTNSGITISWDSTGDAFNYDVDYKKSSTSSWTNALTASADTFAVLSGLSDNTAYDVRVRANWGPGTSSNYSDTNFTTLQFAVTAPNTTISVQAGSTLPVTWSGTTTGITPNVKISLSTNGGVSYPTVLAASTANDNSEQFVLPNIASPTCRIKIESLDSVYFFDVSDTNFIITPKPVECQKLDIQVYKKDTSFTCVTSDDNGFVYAGTQTKGIYRFENNALKNYSYGLNGLIPWKRTWMRQMAVYNNQLWVAHSGYISPIGLEVDNNRYGGIETINVLNGPGDRVNRRGQRVINIDLTIAGPPTRNTFAVYPDTLTGRIWSASNYADSLSYPAAFNYNARYWYKTGGVATMAPGQANFFRNEDGLADPYALGVGTGTAGTESLSIGKRRSASAITADGNEILVSISGYRASTSDTLFTPGLLRYNRATGAYLGKFDQNNSGLPFGLTNTTAAAPALYTDVKGRVWLALGGNRLAVKDTSGWHYIGVPTVLASGGSVQPNAISGDRKGIVYIGTDRGLLIFNNNRDTVSGIASYTKDSSYCLYTTTEGLPTNYIRGTHVDRSGNIWLATGAGLCKIQRGDLMMYNLNPVPGGNYITNNEGKRTSIAGFDPEIENSDTIRVAADGSKATLFKWQGKSPASLKPVIKEGNTPADFGSFTIVHRSVDSFVVQYTHPEQIAAPFNAQGRREITLQLLDTTFAPAKVAIEVKLDVVPPPVLCLHGIWSNGEAFGPMKQNLVDSGGYRSFMVSTPSYPNDVYFINNKYVARDEAARLFLACADNNMSAGKVDIVAHSMGGILSRIFLQSGDYDKTINKLITMNTPHSGSQVADLVRTSPALSAVVNLLLGNNTDNGALEDLRVTKDGIRVLLNGPANLNKNKVPVHAITSKYTDLQVYELLLNVTLTVASYIPALGRAAEVAKRILATLKYTAYAGTTCSTSMSVHDCLKDKIFEDDNDLAVSVTSQKGGLPGSALSFFGNISHNSILDKPEVFPVVRQLLKAPNNDAAFTANGYNPPVLNYNAALRAPSAVTSETITITSPATGTSFAAGQTITVDMAGSTNIRKILVAAGNATLGAGYYNSATQNYSLSYTIPLEAIGRLYFVAIGFDDQGRSTYDTAFINVDLPVGATLDSVRIVNKRNLKVFQEDSVWVRINAHYSDAVRDISNMPGIAYVVDDVNARMSALTPNYVIGQVVGYDNFRATWQGKSDTGYVEILEKRLIPGGGVVIPVTLTSFTGKLVSNTVQLKWNTAQEINASHFEVERSVDGINFSYIGQVKAVGQSNANINYGFNDLQFKTGANYYRLKQVDIDGRFTYSIVVLIRVKKGNQPDVLIFPNPAQKQITVNVTEGQHPQWNLQVQNMVGQPVLRHIIPANQNNELITIDGLAKGVYTVTILSANGDKVYNGKLVVQ